MCTWHIKRFPGQLLISAGLLAATSLIVVGCNTINPPPVELSVVIKACSVSWGIEVSTKVTAKYEDLKKGGEVEWKAAVESGGTLFKHFKGDEIGLQAYNKYIECIKPAIDKFVSADERPTVVLVGSKVDYRDYGLSALEATSVELLHKRLGNYKITPLTVSYGWDNEDSIRKEKPDVIVMHASAFHHDDYKDEAVSKFQALVSSLYALPKTKFLVFSRVPQNFSPDLCQRWNRQIEFLNAGRFQDRLVFYTMLREESNFSGKAGIEVSQIVRCQSGLDATEYCSVYLRKLAQESQDRITSSLCSTASR